MAPRISRTRPASTRSSTPFVRTLDGQRQEHRRSTSPTAWGRSWTTAATSPAGASRCGTSARATVDNLLEGDAYKAADVEGLDLNFDATKVVFAMKHDANDKLSTSTRRTSREGGDPKNPYGIAQLTDGAYDDLTPIWIASGKHRVHHEPDVHGDGHPRRRVQPRRAASRRSRPSPRPVATRDRQALLAEPVARLQPVPDAERSDRLFALGAPRERQRLEAVRDEPGLHADDRARRPARQQAGQLARAGHREQPAKRVHRHRDGPREDASRPARWSRSTRASTNDDTRHDEERATFTVLTPSVPRDSSASPIGRYRYAAHASGRAPARVLGRRQRERHRTSSLNPAGLRHLHLRPEDAHEPARLQRAGDLGALRAAGRSARGAAVARLGEHVARRDEAAHHRLDQRQKDVALLAAPEHGQRRAVRAEHDDGRRAHSRRQGAHHRGLLERGRAERHACSA